MEISLWFPPVKQADLEAFWATQPAFGMGGFRLILGGEWINSSEFKDGDPIFRHFGNLWERLYVPSRYVVEACSDSSSYLQSPDGRMILHAGCSDAFRNDEVEYVEEGLPFWRNKYFKGRLKVKRGKDGKWRYDKRKRKTGGYGPEPEVSDEELSV